MAFSAPARSPDFSNAFDRSSTAAIASSRRCRSMQEASSFTPALLLSILDATSRMD